MSTKQEILTISKNLIQEFGANGFSYQDIADKLKIKKASVHYYFPKKNDLLLELIRFYSDSLQQFLEQLDSNEKLTFKEKLESYFSIYLDLAKDNKQICLCGILAGEIMTLPKTFKKEISAFFLVHELWLTKLFDQAKAKKQIRTKKNSKILSQSILSSLQGALILSRVNLDKTLIVDLIDNIMKEIFE